jgi:hypothetical protein
VSLSSAEESPAATRRHKCRRDMKWMNAVSKLLPIGGRRCHKHRLCPSSAQGRCLQSYMCDGHASLALDNLARGKREVGNIWLWSHYTVQRAGVLRSNVPDVARVPQQRRGVPCRYIHAAPNSHLDCP